MTAIHSEPERQRQTRGTPRPTIRFPEQDLTLSQDEEWCEVHLDGRWERFRFHDYEQLYAVPGLYEELFYRRLKCCSPSRVVGLLDDVLSDHGVPAEKLNVLDVGAGNGMVGEQLRSLGVNRVVGIDIIDAARQAVGRDRPLAYDHYFVADLTDVAAEDQRWLTSAQLNCLTTVAALGFGDIPTAAFATAFNLIASPGWLAFNIKEDFLHDEDESGFSRLIQRMNHAGILRIEAYRRYCHRLSMTGERLHYVAMVATKLRDLPEDMQ